MPFVTGSPAPVVSAGLVVVVSPGLSSDSWSSPPPELPPGPGLRGPSGTGVSCVGLLGPVLSDSLQAVRARTAISAVAKRNRDMGHSFDCTRVSRRGAGLSPFDGQAVFERPLALRTGLAAGVP